MADHVPASSTTSPAPTGSPDEVGYANEPRIPFVLDGRSVTARPGEVLIAAAERAGVFIPRFCYHPRMKPVGMCRMCLVEVASPRGPALQPSCFIPVTEGMEVVTTSERVKKAQDGVHEFLLINHPLDCPVCDKGGECPLQDQTLAYGPGESRFVEEKRHFEKPIALSNLVLLDRERCIQCGRCTRFAEEIAGEAQIDFAGRGERLEVAKFPTTSFSSYFSGNTVQICPVGALTATPYRFTARPWDLDQVESTCTTCALGCRVAVQSSANRLTRLLGIDVDPVNQSWLCDKGRYVFESVNGDEALVPGAAFAGEARPAGRGATVRLTQPLVRTHGELVPASWGEALGAAADGLRRVRAVGGPEAVAVLGGARLTNEGAYAWAKLAKGVIGTDSVDAQLGDGLPAELVLSLPRATIDEACRAKVLVTLTGDVREELPVLFLRVRQAVLSGATRLVELTYQTTSLTPYAAASLLMRSGDAPGLARLLVGGSAIASGAPFHPDGPPWSPAQLATARDLLAETPEGAGVVVLVGRPSLAEDASLVAEAVEVLANAWPAARFLPTLRRGNVHGALDMGFAPGLLPGRVSLEEGRAWFRRFWPTVPERTGRSGAAVLASLAGDLEDPDGASDQREAPKGPPIGALVLLGADPVGDFPDRQLAERALAAAEFVVVVGGHPSASLHHADVVLPAAVAHERPGTTTNVEGRVSRLGQKLVAPGLAWPDWMIAAELAASLGADLGFTSASAVLEEIGRVAPSYRGIDAAIEEGTHRDGVIVPLVGRGVERFEPIDPIATPGVESVERQGAPPRVGSARIGAWVVPVSVEGSGEGVPRLLSWPSYVAKRTSTRPTHVSPPDAYTLRLVSGRRLYDRGSAVLGSPSLVPLVPKAPARINPHDLDRFGIDDGDAVRVRSSRGSLVMRAEADPNVARGTVVIDFNLTVAVPDHRDAPGREALRRETTAEKDRRGTERPEDAQRELGASVLIDAMAPVTDIRLESL